MPRIVLVDAAGVLYLDTEAIPGAGAAIRYLKENGVRVFCVTNNTCQHPSLITQMLAKKDVLFKEDEIISSGFGLQMDEEVHSLVSGKKIFVYGKDTSFFYIEAAGGHRVDRIEEAEAVVLTSTVDERHDIRFTMLRQSLAEHPRPVICSNPDRLVATPNGLDTVIGHDAAILEADGIPVYWMGKPYPEFCHVVRKYLQKKGLVLGQADIFFDDNYHNVAMMAGTLGINGCLVHKTGISAGIPLEDLIPNPAVGYAVDSFCI